MLLLQLLLTMLFSKATSLHQTWHPACPHQGHTGDSCPSKVEASFMHTMCKSGKRRYEVVNDSALCVASNLPSSLSPPRAHCRQQVLLGRVSYALASAQFVTSNIKCKCVALCLRACLHISLQTWLRACTDLHIPCSTSGKTKSVQEQQSRSSKSKGLGVCIEEQEVVR